MLNMLERVALKALANAQLSGIAKLKTLEVDGDKLRGVIQLPDKDIPEITVTLYGVERRGMTSMTFKRAEASRPWVAEALNRFLAGEVIGAST